MNELLTNLFDNYSCKERRIIVPRFVAYESIRPCRKP